MNPVANPPKTTPPVVNDVLQSDHHSHFTPEDIAKAVARHQREHPAQAPRNLKPQKTTPRH
ncbi:MAG TPA: hypothetical protein VL990_14730 [Acidobacteriaceae bacterium]|nr:hypothetical protein [Acidobacteriaceae bacterium]